MIHNQEEHKIQKAFFEIVKIVSKKKKHYALIHAIPNGGARDAVTGARLKAEGVLSGVPDVFVPFARGGFHGMYIEFKANKRKMTDNQVWFAENVRKLGYAHHVVFSARAAFDLLENYDNERAA